MKRTMFKEPLRMGHGAEHGERLACTSPISCLALTQMLIISTDAMPIL